MRTIHTFVLLFALGACGAKATPAPADPGPQTTLFERLGGIPAITAVVKEFVKTTGSDPRISDFFLNVDIPRLEQMMVDHICSITGGGCEYKGKTMKESHAAMVKKIHEPDFAAFMDDLDKTLTKLKVPEREKAEVLGAFNSLKPEVIQP